MTIVCPARSSLSLLGFALVAAACSSSSKKSTPDAPPAVNPAADASIATPPDGAGFEASSEAQGEAGQTSQLTVSPASIDVGTILPAVPSPRQTITVTATTDIANLTVSLIGGDLTFENTTTCGKTLAAGNSCRVVITFLSRTIGSKTDSVDIAAGGTTTVVPVTAKVQGDNSLMLTPSTPQSFGASIGQASWPITFYVPNAGDTAIGPVTYELTGVDAAEFSATAAGCDLIAPGTACTITVVFTPRAATGSAKIATLKVTGPGPDAPTYQVVLTGTIHSFDSIWLSSPTSDLGSVAVGTTGPSFTFTLRNSGSTAEGPFTITLSSSEFVLTSDTCSTSAIPAGGTCTVDVALRPASTGAKSAILKVGLSSGSPAVKTVTGTGVAINAGMVDAPDNAGLDASGEAQGAAGSEGEAGSAG